MSVYKSAAFLNRTRPLARNTDPVTSHDAARHMRESGKLGDQCAQVLAALKRLPLHTAKELSRDSGLDYIMIQKRLSVLESRGLARRMGERLCTLSNTGLKVTQWEAA